MKSKKSINPISIIEKYYDKDSKSYKILIEHSKQVAKKAIEIAKDNMGKKPDLEFIEEAAMLHDIGLFKIKSKWFGCEGTGKYAEHGYLGAEILREEGLLDYAKVAERHTGVGIFKEDVERFELNIPAQDYLPETVNEEIVCLADKFFSKSKPYLEKSVEQIREGLLKVGEKHANRFDDLCKKYRLV